MDAACEHYLQLSSGQKNPLPREAIQTLFCLMNWREIRNDTSLKAAAKEVNDLLNEMIISNRAKCEVVAEILSRQERLKSKDVIAPAAYLSKILSDDSKVYQTANAGEIIEKIIKQVSKSVSFSDFLAVLMSEGGKGENLAECGFLLPWIKTVWQDSDGPRCFVNATPAFLAEWELSDKDTITVPYDTAKKPIQELSNVKVFSMDELEAIQFFSGSRVLYFARGYTKEDVQQHLQNLCRDHAQVYAVLPDIYKSVTMGISGYSVSNVTILPTDLVRGGIRKYFVVTLVPDSKEGIEAQTVLTEKIDGRYYCAPAALWPKTELNAADYMTRQTIRSLFFRAATKKEDIKERNRPVEYVFSPELKLWYITKPNKAGNQTVCLYLCKVPTEQQRKRNKYARGAKIKSTETWNTNIPKDKIESWIEQTGAYNEKLRSEAVKQIELYNNKTLSLKSLWYCLCDRAGFSDEEEVQINTFLQTRGAELIIGSISEEDIEKAVLLSSESAEILIPLLDKLFDVAVRRKYIKIHPFEALREARKKQKRREESIRALAKRSYTETEEEKIWEYYKKNSENSGCLGMIICLLTGLTPPYVAALTWRDWRKITYTAHTQLVANKKLLPDGELEWQTEEDSCRLLPVMDVLSEILLSWKQRIMPQPDERIVSTEGNPLQLIRRHIRGAEEYADIAPDLISVPDSDKMMDLNQYAGSRMRENFERHCYVDCGMTDAEVHYLILRKMPDTLSRNYADFGHECIQERMSVKLNQWGQRFKGSGAKKWRAVKLSKQKITLESGNNYVESYYLTARTRDRLALVADCDHDFEYRFRVSRNYRT